MRRSFLLVGLCLLAAAELPAAQEAARRFNLPGGGEGATLSGRADHTIIARRAADGTLELTCLQGDEHLARQVLAAGRPTPHAAPMTAHAAVASRAASISATLIVDPDRPAGADEDGNVLIYTPDPVEPGSSVSHFDRSASPNLLMEPSISSDLPLNGVDLADKALRDMGWRGGRFTAAFQFTDAAGTGFNDATLGATRQAAVRHAAEIWGGGSAR